MVASTKTVNKTQAYLTALDSSFSNRKYSIPASGLIIGRGQKQSDIVVSDKTISRQHISIQQDENGHFIAIDLQSTNGVFINKKRIQTQAVLQDGDIIGLGYPMAVHLRFQHKNTQSNSSVFQLSPQKYWIIGRDNKADISLSFDPTVSSTHAQITYQKQQLSIKDLKSLNGTFLNGQKVCQSKLQDSDTVVIGSSYFHFSLAADESLIVSQRECGDDIQIECVGLKRIVPIGRKNHKKILHDISLQINPGEFVGILGPSGAGKSTLLKSICGHTVPDAGCVLLNETPLYRSYDMFRSIIGYVPQDDILHAELTVEKSLEYVAKLRLPKDIDIKQRDNIVQSTIEALGLSHVKQNKIEQLSGGQRKRVSIGAELITRPSVLFLDEPTSGLDPSVEERLMKHFQDMTDKGTTILITTHILYNLSMLDKIIFMSQGSLVFYGTPDEALLFFNESDVSLTVPTQIFDLLEGLMDCTITSGITKEHEKKEALAQYFADKYRQSQFYEKHVTHNLSPFAQSLTALSNTDETTSTKNQEQHLENLLSSPLARKWSLAQIKKCFSLRQWFLLSSRHLTIRFASVRQTLIYFMIPLVLALVTLTQTVNGFLDENTIAAQRTAIVEAVSKSGNPVEKQLQVLLSTDGQVGIRSAADLLHAMKHEGIVNLPVPMGMLLMFVMTSIFMGAFIACQEISPERSIRFREQMTGQRILDYIGSKLSFCLSVTAIQCTLYLGICYLAPGLRAVPFQALLPILIIIAWTSVAMGLFLSAVDPSSGQFSIILAIVAVLPQLILSGGLGPDFYLGMNDISRFIADFFPARWGLELFLTATYFNDAGDPFTWIPSFITNNIGFDYGNIVLSRDMLLLAAQMLFWLGVTALVLKRK